MSTEKKHTPEFEQCIADVMKQGHEKGSAFAICTKTFQDADKPLYVGESETQKLHLFSESINLEGNRVSGVAIHPKRIFHPEEGMTHVYLKEELELAAPTLTGKPFGIDHLYPLPPPNLITKSWYDPKENGVAFEGLVDDKIAEQIRNKAFKGLSIELNWLKPGGKVEFVDGIAPRNFELTSLHLLHRFPPGDKDAFLKVEEGLWDKIMEQQAQSPPLDQRVANLEHRLGELAIKEGAKMKEEDLTKIVEAAVRNALREAEWDTEYINDLPDSAFAVIGGGGEKDEKGKTMPRTLRHLPHHNADGSLDLPHLRNALARMNQIEGASQAEAKKHLCAHAKESQIVSEFCGEQPNPKESEELVTVRKKLVEAEAEAAKVRSQMVDKEAAWKEAYGRLSRGIRGSIPPAHIWKAWSSGPQKLIQEQLKILRECEGE